MPELYIGVCVFSKAPKHDMYTVVFPYILSEGYRVVETDEEYRMSWFIVV